MANEKLSQLSGVEQFVFDRTKLGEVNFQPQDNLRAYTASYLLRGILAGHPQINGSLPKEEASLVVANHTGGKDVFIMYLLPILTVNRTLRLVAKEALVNPDAHESEAMKNRRRKSPFKKVLAALGIDRVVNRYVAVPYARSFRVIPMNMGDESGLSNIRSFREIRRELAAGNLVGVFQTGTRKPPLDFLDTLPLAAKIAVNAPDLPVTPVGISGSVVNIGESITFRQVLQEKNIQGEVYIRDGLRIMDRTIADRIAGLVEDPRLYPVWWLERHGVFSEEQLRLMVAAKQDIYKIYLQAQKDMKAGF